MTDRRIKRAIRNASRFRSYWMAAKASRDQVYYTPVLLGDDERFWVPATNREAGYLIRAGYEIAE